MENYNKKAQIATTISWFVATLVIVLIIIVFLIFGPGRTVAVNTSVGKQSITLIDENKTLQQSEQQRRNFFFMEIDEDTKITREVLRSFIQTLTEKKKPDKGEISSINGTIKEIFRKRKSSGLCFEIAIRDREIEESFSPGLVGLRRIKKIEYFIYPPGEFKGDLISGDYTTQIDWANNVYTYHFLEKPFALIKYNETLCP